MDSFSALTHLLTRVNNLKNSAMVLRENKVFSDPEVKAVLDQIKGSSESWSNILSRKLKDR